MINKLRVFFDDLMKVSRITKTKNKKKTIFLLAIISNALVFFDILIILYFSKIFSQEIQFSNTIINYFLDNLYYLPIAVLLRFLFIYLEKVITVNLQINIEKSLRVHLLNEVFTRGNVSISDAYYYINNLSPQVGSFYSTLAVFIGSFIQIVVFSGYLLFSNFTVVAIFTTGVVLLFIPTLLLTKLGRKFAHIAYESGNKISQDIEKVLDNLFLIKIIKKVKDEVTNFEVSLKTFYSSRINDIKVGTANYLMPNFFTLLSLSILIVFFDFMKYLTFDFIGILLRLFQSLGIFNKNIHTVSSFHVYLEKLYEIEINKRHINANNFKINKNSNSEFAVSVRDVSFRYLGMDNYMFENLNLNIPRNQHTILTGPNGSGKSTLLGLLTGIYYPNEGLVESSTEKFGYVSATPMILNSTLRNNLNYGISKAVDDEKLEKLIKDFKLFNNSDISDLDKEISNKTLSTGQMQKVSFIRALAAGIDILILDESTSNLDTDTKRLIFSIIDKQKITIINSTHNPEDFVGIDNQITIKLSDERRLIEYKKL